MHSEFKKTTIVNVQDFINFSYRATEKNNQVYDNYIRTIKKLSIFEHRR